MCWLALEWCIWTGVAIVHCHACVDFVKDQGCEWYIGPLFIRTKDWPPSAYHMFILIECGLHVCECTMMAPWKSNGDPYRICVWCIALNVLWECHVHFHSLLVPIHSLDVVCHYGLGPCDKLQLVMVGWDKRPREAKKGEGNFECVTTYIGPLLLEDACKRVTLINIVTHDIGLWEPEVVNDTSNVHKWPMFIEVKMALARTYLSAS